MAQFSDAQLSKWAQEYEKQLSVTYDYIVDRISLEITHAVGVYELPNYVSNIRSVIYQGVPLLPKGSTQSRLSNDTPQTPIATMKPIEYVYNSIGTSRIRFLPYPSEDVAEYVGNLFSPEADNDYVIIEFTRAANPANANTKLPNWMRRYFLKNYVCGKVFRMEGPQQDLRAAMFYSEKLISDAVLLNKIKSNMFMGYSRIVSGEKIEGYKRPARPVLPDNFPR